MEKLHLYYNKCLGIFLSIAALSNTSAIGTGLMILQYIRTRNTLKETTFEEEVEKRKNRFL